MIISMKIICTKNKKQFKKSITVYVYEMFYNAIKIKLSQYYKSEFKKKEE